MADARPRRAPPQPSGSSLYALVAGSYAAWKRRRRLARLGAERAARRASRTTLVAAVVLLVALARHDFTFVYVCGAHEPRRCRSATRSPRSGAARRARCCSGCSSSPATRALAVWLNRRCARPGRLGRAGARRRSRRSSPSCSVVVSSPFDTQPAPADGAGLVPSLQNPYMLAHPPLLYLGYVGLTIPFAFAMGALLSGRTDERWIVATRRWTLAAWTFLGVGQLLGSHWAYVEIGWGGYYAWDPVENAALMPWLAATAFLHSVMIQEKRGC